MQPTKQELALRAMAASVGLFSLTQLALAAGVARNTVYNTMLHRRVPHPTTITKLADALKVEPDVVRSALGGGSHGA